MTITDIPTIYSINQVGGAARPSDLVNAQATLAPCRILNCTDRSQISLGGKNFCRSHASQIVDDFPAFELDLLAATGWIAGPKSIYECPTNLPRISLDGDAPIHI